MAKKTPAEKEAERRTKALASQKRMQERAREKQQAKQADPEWRQEQRDKQRATQERQQAKALAKRNDPVFQQQERDKAQAKRDTAAQKQRDQYEDPAWQEEQRQKQVSSLHDVIEKSKTDKVNHNRMIVGNSAASRKSRGLIGRTPTADEKRKADKLGALPCICCSLLVHKKLIHAVPENNSQSNFVSLHHIDGRTKELAHYKQLPLCGYHHDVTIDKELQVHPEYKYLIPIHEKGSNWGGKRKWSNQFGSEKELLAVCYSLIDELDFFETYLS